MVKISRGSEGSGLNARVLLSNRILIRCTLLVIAIASCQFLLQQDADTETGTTRTKPVHRIIPAPVSLTHEEAKLAQSATLVTLDDFKDLSAFDLANNPASKGKGSTERKDTSTEKALRKPILEQLRRAGLEVDEEVLRSLPTWRQVKNLYGAKPLILGKETCKGFREAIPLNRRFVGVAGQMNTGTNALAAYFRENLVIPENEILNGILWTVPWYKHSWTSLRNKYKYRLPDKHEAVMPIVVVRDPYFWMKSMCESPYTLEWNRTGGHCPNLIEESTIMDADITPETASIPPEMGVPVTIQWGRWRKSWKSLAHVWNDWYRDYLEADFPRLIIRFEDLLFHTEDVIEEIRDCVGAQWKHENFVYRTAPVKTAEYFEKFKKQTGLVSALIKYGHDNGKRTMNMTEEDLDYAEQYLDTDLMDLFHYHAPDALG